MRFSLLGPLVVTDDAGGRVTVGGPRLRVLLAALLLHANVPVPAGMLAELVWDGSPPSGAVSTLRSYIRRLRRAVDPDAARIAACSPGYVIRVEPAELDVLEFEALCLDARAALRAGECADASAAAVRALGLWRAAPLLDVPAEALLDEFVPRLERLRLQVLEDRFDAGLRLGQHRELIAQLMDLTARHPLRERFHAQLMLALASTGRRAEALCAYQQARGVLVDELGIGPGRELRDIHLQVLAGDAAETTSAPDGTDPGEVPSPALAGPPADVAGCAARERDAAHLYPDHMPPAEGPRIDGPEPNPLRQPIAGADPALAGPEPGWRVGSPAAAAEWLPLFQLPAAPPDFTGRRAECELIADALAQDDVVPVVAICGQPGVGKTALALRIAHQVRHRFPDGQLWVQLAGASARPHDPGEVLGELLRALGTPGSAVPGDPVGRASAFRSRIAGRRLLIVADDASSAEQAAALLPGTPGCALVVTSRMRLEGLTGARMIPLDVLAREEAVTLLSRILGDARIEADPAGADDLAEACGELPLALRVAGARLATRPSWPLPTMTRRLTSLRGRLRELETGNLSVRAGIAASYDLLPDRNQRAFRLLSVLGPSDFAEWVVPVLLGEPDAAGVLEDLVSRSLVNPAGVDASGQPRYRLHDLLRDYAAERLSDDPAPARQAATDRLLAAYLQLGIAASGGLPPEPFFPPPVFSSRPAPLADHLAGELTIDPIAWFTAERQNLLAAVDLACAAGQFVLAGELADAQSAYQHLQDRYDDAERSWSLLAGRGDVYARLRVVSSLVERGQVAEARPILDWCAEQVPDTGLMAQVAYWQGACAWDLDDADQARRFASQSVELARQAESPQVEMMSTRLLSHTYLHAGETGAALATVESALSLAAELCEAPYELAVLHDLAVACVLTGQYDRSIQVCHRRIEMSRELGDVRAEAYCHGVLGDAYAAQGRQELAIQSLQRALPVFEKHHALRDYGTCLLKLGYAYEELGSYPEAARYLDRARQVFEQLRVPAKAEVARHALCRCREALGD